VRGVYSPHSLSIHKKSKVREMSNPRIIDIHHDKVPTGNYELYGWVKTHRQSKNISFIELSDGSSVKGLQLVIEPDLASYSGIAARTSTGASISVKGELVESPAKGQKYEFQVGEINLIGEADSESYALQKKGHTLEFLREHLHLRPRSNTLGAVFRVRSVAAMAVHQFFQEKGFVYVTTPLITTSDCEGAGEMFRVTTLDLERLPRADGKIDYTHDFFKEEAHLTVSGQLEAEAFATALTNVYTFGPTFRSENSNTARHLSEFWMIEPEMAFCNLQGNMNIAEEFVRSMISRILEHCADDIDFLLKREWADKGLLVTLQSVVDSSFEVLEYSEAVKILEDSGKQFEFPIQYGMDLQSEHERFLTDVHVKGPAIVINYPKEIKPFYMRHNDDGRTVRAMDVLVPRLGEIIGGSQREERLDQLTMRMKEMNIPNEDLEWYLDLRRFGSVPHAGFGFGFERFLMYITGMQNIRDVIPFPRHPGFAKF